MSVREEAPEASLGTEPESARRGVVELLTRAYWLKIEAVMTYIAASMSQAGAHDIEIKAALVEGVEQEVQHAQLLGRRIQELCGVVPAAGDIAADGEFPLPPARQGEIAAMIEAVVRAETASIRHCMRIRWATFEIDEVTCAMALGILRDEQAHLRLFEGYLSSRAEPRQSSTASRASRNPSV